MEFLLYLIKIQLLVKMGISHGPEMHDLLHKYIKLEKQNNNHVL